MTAQNDLENLSVAHQSGGLEIIPTVTSPEMLVLASQLGILIDQAHPHMSNEEDGQRRLCEEIHHQKERHAHLEEVAATTSLHRQVTSEGIQDDHL